MVHRGRGEGIRLHRSGDRAGRRRQRPERGLSPEPDRTGRPPPASLPPASLAAAAERLEALAPGYLARVRRAALRLAHRDDSTVDVVTALADVEDAAALDVDVPVLSNRRAGRLVKAAVKRLIAWYLRYLTQQVTAFNGAVSRFGAALVERTDQIEETTTGLARDLQRLAERVDRLEERRGGNSGDQPG